MRLEMADGKTASSKRSGGPTVPEAVAAWLRIRGIIRTGILASVSGGADSVGLLRALDACREPLELDVCVAHLDHGLRTESAADAEWVRTLSMRLGLPAIIERVDVGRRAAETGDGIEETARRARYEFFRRVAVEQGCSDVAVAHTADDQAETILHHMIRGTGLAGLRGMPEARPLSPERTLIRPLLRIPRTDVLGYLGELGQEYRSDATNEDERFTRNRLRHSLLPLLSEQFNPRVAEALARLGRQVDEVQRIIEQFAGQLLESSILERHPDSVVLNAIPLQNAERHLVRESLRLLWTDQHWPRRRMGFDDWNRLAALIQSPQSSTSLDLPHRFRASKSRQFVRIAPASGN